MYEKINRFVPDLERLGWRWYAAVACTLYATVEFPWKGWWQLAPGACLGIALLLTILGFLRTWVIDPLRKELLQTHPDDLDIPLVPPLP